MSYNFDVAAGSSVKFPVGGKYCDRDIVVTATGGGVNLPDLTNPAAAEQIVEGYEAINESGAVVTGTNPYEKEATDTTVNTQAGLIEQIQLALEGKAAGGGNDEYAESLKGILERTATSPALPANLRTLGANVFQQYSALTTIKLPFGVTKISDSACHSCANLASVSLPDSLTTIEALAFYGCAALTTLTLPRSIESIAMWAFNGCTGLSTVTFTGTPVSLTGNVFSGCTNLTTINVPWAEGEVANAPWGATNATINYNYTGEA